MPNRRRRDLQGFPSGRRGKVSNVRSMPLTGRNPQITANVTDPAAVAESGRRAGPRNPCPYGRGGSSPLSRIGIGGDAVHRETTVKRALALAEGGTNGGEISRSGFRGQRCATGSTGAIPRSRPRRHGVDACVRCNPDRPLADLAPAYVYLLGLYLGDGCISLYRRGVYKLRIVLDLKHPGIIGSAEAAMREVRSGKTHTYRRRRQNCVEVSSYWKHWPCLFPQHDIGKKFERRIELAEWQMELVRHWPDEMPRGVIQSDGRTPAGAIGSPAVRLLAGIDRHSGHLLRGVRAGGGSL